MLKKSVLIVIKNIKIAIKINICSRENFKLRTDLIIRCTS